MKPVQFILIAMVLTVVVLYFNKLRSGVLDRLVVLIFAGLGMSMLLFPDWTNQLAHFVGVDSGAHLFIYLAILGLGFFGLLIYSKLREMHQMMTDLIRRVAIDRAHDGATSPPPPESTRGEGDTR